MIDLERLIREAIKNKEPLKANLYRMVKTKVVNIVTAKGRKDRTVKAEDILNAIKKEYKEVREELKYVNPSNSAVYKELCAKLSYLDNLLPKVAPLDEAIELIKEHLLATHNTNFGAIMGYIKKTGKNFDMKAVAAKVKEML